MTTRLLIGHVFDRMRELPDHSFDLIVTSPPFYGVRSYLPDDHPQKHLEIGTEDTPAEYLDKLFALTAEWRRLLAPHGSLAVELGDTYAGSGGAGGDYDENGLRDGQLKFRVDWSKSGISAKSLVGIPQSYMLGLIHGRNPITGAPSPAGQWRVRNLKPWIRSNPPVGALGDKERPATSYITVACVGGSRWFDLDAVRTPAQPGSYGTDGRPDHDRSGNGFRGVTQGPTHYPRTDSHPGGAPPLDWWHQVDAVIDRVLDERAGKYNGGEVNTVGKSSASRGISGGDSGNPDKPRDNGSRSVGARGYHVRRELEAVGLLPRGDFYDVSPKGYAGSHYAVWPKELVKLLIAEMAPPFVCPRCGPLRKLESRDDATSLRDLRRADNDPIVQQSDGRETPVLFKSLRHGSQARSETSRDDGSGISPREPSVRLRSGSSAGASDGSQVGVAVRASTDNGGASRSDVDGRRGRPPQERDPGRQPHREPRADDTTGPPQDSDATLEAEALSTLRRDGSSDRPCPSCGTTLRRGIVLDPFSGSGTTLAVASGMGRDSVGIDLDERNADLARERCGMFLEVEYPEREVPA